MRHFDLIGFVTRTRDAPEAFTRVVRTTMEAKLQSLKVPELKELLQKAHLSAAGNKPDLIKRLLENPQATESLRCV